MLIGEVKTGRRPYRILFHQRRKTFFVSSWADGSVSAIPDCRQRTLLDIIRLGAAHRRYGLEAGRRKAWVARRRRQ